ncbi:o-succinylbenzoate synthase [Motiliproteus sp. SC1-56]|uniref:o-succinylbenzoate synthase n=1 Tax=Motiliproteus sp. SC1-56 TaxID=2799565 RepID=UPI001A8F27F0|nr:o-succinylbenzoate synthase [Motiliproteus sp. SC1-56]
MTRRAALYRYRVPLVRPLRLAFGTLCVREGVVLELQDGERQGWGEAAPLPGFSPDSLDQAEQRLRRLATGWLDEVPVARTSDSPAAAFAFDCARWELDKGLLVADPTLGAYPLLAGSREQQQRQWLALRDQPPVSIKLKLGGEAPASDAAWLQQLLDDAPRLRLRLDINRRWTRAQAEQFASALSKDLRAAIDYIEEPCQQLQQSLAWAEQQRLPLGLDESLSECGERLPDSPALKALILKPTLVGSLSRLQRWLEQARRRGMRTLLSSCFESPLALGQLAALARELTPDEPPGLDTLGPWPQDLIRPLPNSTRPLLPLEQLTCLWRS